MSLPAELIGNAYSGSHVWNVLKQLTAVEDRSAGSAGEARAAEILETVFDRCGCADASTRTFSIPGWTRGRSALTLHGPADQRYENAHEVLTLPRSPAGTVTAPLVDIGDGTPADFEGNDLQETIVLVSSLTPKDHDQWIHRTEKYYRAIDAGAVGFVFYNDQSGCLPATGNVGSGDGPGAIPAVGVSSELGARLVRACRCERTTATLDVDCENERMTSQSVTATLGPDTEREVLVTAHHDAHDISEGATDNAAGCAVVAEVARLLATVEGDLETRVRFVTFGAEELHLLGSEAWAADTDPETVTAVINLDGIGSSRDPVVSTHGIDAIEATFREVSDELGVPIECDEGLVPWGDQWPFVYRGVPGAMVFSKNEADALRGWGHTHADTLDKVDRRDLRELAVPVAAAVCKLAEADREVDRRSPEAVRQSAIDEGHADGMRLAGVWPWD